MNLSKTFNSFRKTGIAEGISFLLLLFIAMPLKYFAGFPIAVTIVGSIHGILFMAYLVLAWETRNEPVISAWKKTFPWMATCFIASILPFGPFVLENRLKKEQMQP